MLLPDETTPFSYTVTIDEFSRVQLEFFKWIREMPDGFGTYAYSQFSNRGKTIRFSSRDAAWACLLIFGKLLEPKKPLPNPVDYRGRRDIHTLVELRDWLNDLPEDTWSIQTEMVIRSDTFLPANVIVLRFARPEEAFSFKLRWTHAVNHTGTNLY